MGIDTWIELNKKRGFNGCKTFEDVVKFLNKFYEDSIKLNKSGGENDI
jgi:hypothetical protein